MATNFEDYWDKLCQENPNLYDESTKMTMTAASFRAQVKKAYAASAQTTYSSICIYFPSYWRKICRDNPALRNKSMKMTWGSVPKIVET